MKYHELFQVRSLPVYQNKMFSDRTAALACPRGDVTLVQDMETGLIFNSSFDPQSLKYDVDYQNEQAVSPVFQRHLEDVKQIIDRNFFGLSLIEVGCGKGYFLEYLEREGYRIAGVDPAYEGKNPRIIRSCFDGNLGLRADGILLRHVLEHVMDPVEFLGKIARANDGRGKIYIEVPCFDWICAHKAWFDIFYEHVNYFRSADFNRIFGKVYDTGYVFGGQYLYVVADLATLRSPRVDCPAKIQFPNNFLSNINDWVTLAKQRNSMIWGGASKGVIFSVYMKNAGVLFTYLIDINPAKRGKFTPGDGLKVLSPEEGIKHLSVGDNIFVMNSNYLQEVLTLTQGQYNYIEVDRDKF